MAGANISVLKLVALSSIGPYLEIMTAPADPLDGATVHPVRIRPSGRPEMSERGCQETLRSGRQCTYPALEDSLFCGYHHSIAKADPTHDVIRYREQMMDHARIELLRMSPKAAETIEQILDSDTVPAQVKLKAATEVWDRIGIRGGMDLDINAEVHTDPAEDIRKRLEAMGAGILHALSTQSAPIPEESLPIAGEVIADEPSTGELTDSGSGSTAGGDQPSDSADQDQV